MSLISEENKSTPHHVPKKLCENRYCNQEAFSILVCWGKDEKNKLKQQISKVKAPSFEVTEFPSAEYLHDLLKIATINSDVFAMADSGEVFEKLRNKFTSFITYGETSEIWLQNRTEQRFYYCVCSFMSKLYVIGGRVFGYDKARSSCLTYDTKTAKWSKLADVNEGRSYSACTAFGGKVVVSGGGNGTRKIRKLFLKSVEAYDYYENK